MFLIIYSLTIGLLLLAGILLLALKKLLHLGRVLIMLAASGISFAAWFIGAIFLMSNVHQNFYLWMLLIFLLLLMMLLGLILWGGFKTKLLSIPVCSMIALCLVVTLGFHSWTVIQDRIPTVGEGGDLLSQYSPFEESMGAELEEPAALQLQGLDLPKLDGATAMYPIYSAFFKAVYTDQYESHITCSTTTMAYDNIITGEADIIFVGGLPRIRRKPLRRRGWNWSILPSAEKPLSFSSTVKIPSMILP